VGHEAAATTAIARQSDDATLRDLPRRILSMPLTQLPEAVDLARSRDAVGMQEEIMHACLQRILSHGNVDVRTPRMEQTRTLRRLIFGQSDVLLVARTGFGKSLIFHAYSILTSKITLQLIPLTKLGDEQLSDIRRFSGARPCLVNAKTKKEEKHLLRRILAGEFTHILLGPEQASTRAFRDVLKSTEFQARIGLVAIDECHLVMEWEKFRPAFTLIGELRTILHQNIVWFGCSATLDAAGEKRVLETAGFRPIGNRMYHTEVIRTSIDRPDVALCVIPIPQGKLTCWDALYFLLHSATCDRRATPSNIPKTIVFVDGRRLVHEAAAWAVNELQQLSDEYTINSLAEERCVLNVIRIFTAYVAQYDRDLAYYEFCRPTSKIRIMFATTSLGMGINIPDVARVVTWKVPITASLGDLWQRIGRGGRGAGLSSTAYVMLPYYLFDTEGTCKPGARPPTPAGSPGPTSRARRSMKNQLPSDRARLRSYLSQCTTPGDTINPDDSSQELLTTQSNTDPPDSQDSGRRRPRYWTKAEIGQRDSLPGPWLRMVNGSCHREGFLINLGEETLAVFERQFVTKDRCCSACNPALLPDVVFPPARLGQLVAPRSSTHAHYIYQLIEALAVQRATVLFTGENCRFLMPPGAYMPRSCRLELVYALVGAIPEPDEEAPLVTGDLAFNAMCVKVPLLRSWDLRNTECGELMRALPNVKRAALDDFMKYSESTRRLREDRRRDQLQDDREVGCEAQSAVAFKNICQQRDNEVAAQVAEEVSRQAAVVLSGQATSSTVPTPPSPSSCSVQTPKRRRIPLQACSASSVNKRRRQLDTAVDALPKSSAAALSFTPLSSRGRIRTLTPKGQENYR